MGGDPQIISGESGAVTLGVVTEIMLNQRLNGLKETLQLNSDSVVLIISTEGDTDRDHYRKIVWDGLYPSCDLKKCFDTTTSQGLSSLLKTFQRLLDLLVSPEVIPALSSKSDIKDVQVRRIRQEL